MYLLSAEKQSQVELNSSNGTKDMTIYLSVYWPDHGLAFPRWRFTSPLRWRWGLVLALELFQPSFLCISPPEHETTHTVRLHTKPQYHWHTSTCWKEAWRNERPSPSVVAANRKKQTMVILSLWPIYYRLLVGTLNSFSIVQLLLQCQNHWDTIVSVSNNDAVGPCPEFLNKIKF